LIRKRLLKFGHGRRQTALNRQCDGEVEVGFGAVGLQARGDLPLGLRLVRLALLGEQLRRLLCASAYPVQPERGFSIPATPPHPAPR